MKTNRNSSLIAVTVPAIVGGVLGALAAYVLPSGNQGDVLSSTAIPAAANS